MSASYCERSGKLRFSTPAKARKAAEGLMHHRRGKAKHYQCDDCKDWHVTNATNLINPRKR